jgi:hypothetical protein
MFIILIVKQTFDKMPYTKGKKKIQQHFIKAARNKAKWIARRKAKLEQGNDDYDWSNRTRTVVSMGSTYTDEMETFGGHNVIVSGIRGLEKKIEFNKQPCSKCQRDHDCSSNGCQCDDNDEPCNCCQCDDNDEPCNYKSDDIDKLCSLLVRKRKYTFVFDSYFHYSEVPLALTSLFKIVMTGLSDRHDQEWIFIGQGRT